MRCTEWFHGREVDERQEEPGLPWGLWLVLLIAAGIACLPGCATELDGICAVQPIGQDENGVAFFRYHCEPTK